MRSVYCFTFVCLLAFGLSESYESENRNDLRIIDSIRPEPECNAAGGSCVIAEDCTGELSKKTGLCPSQADKGVECCYGLSRKETRCEKLGGTCMPLNEFCNPRIVLQQATDCHNQKCCLLVN